MTSDVEPEKQFSPFVLLTGRALTIVASAVGFLWGAFTSPSPIVGLLSGLLGLGSWLLAAIYVADVMAYLSKPVSGQHGKLTYDMHYEIWRDFIIGLFTGLSLILIYHLAHHAYDSAGIDIGSLALPFLISALVFCFPALRDARAIHPVRGWIILFFGLAIIVSGTLIYYELTLIVEGRYSLAYSAWMQCTMLMASIAIFMLMRKMAFSLNKRLSFFSPFAVALSRQFVRQDQYEALTSRLAQEPMKVGPTMKQPGED